MTEEGAGRIRSWIVALAGFGMACAACGSGRREVPGPPDSGDEAGIDAGTDRDGDGFAGEGGPDCDDTDPSVHPGAPDNDEWRIEDVAEVGFDTSEVSLVLDVRGDAHVAFCDRERYVLEGGGYAWTILRYATDATGDWVSTDVDAESTSCAGAAIVVDGESLRVLYVRGNAWSEVTLATNEGASWAFETVASGVEAWTRQTSIATVGGELHALYQESFSGRTYHATRSAGVWTSEQVEETSGIASGGSLAITAAGTVRATWAAGGPGGTEGDLRFGSRDDSGWHVDVLVPWVAAGQGTSFTSLAVDTAGRNHVVYSSGGYVGNMSYASDASGEWTFEPLDAGGFGGSLRLDDAGHAHVAYYAEHPERSEQELLYATDTGGAWTFQSVETNGSSPSLVLDARGLAHVAYRFWPNPGTIRYAVQDPHADGIDQNCDGTDGVDADGDGHASAASGGDDCDDADPVRLDGCGP